MSASCKCTTADCVDLYHQVGRPLQACGTCGPEEYCSLSTGQPGCERCTVCPAGFFMVAECTVHADRICQASTETFLPPTKPCPNPNPSSVVAL